MNQFLRSTQEAINRNGVSIVYKKVGTQSYDPASGAVTSTDVNYTLKAYPKHIRSSQWHFPDLIGKEAVMFYIAGSQSFTPELKDLITYDSVEYRVDSIQRHFAAGATCLYRIVAVKG